ncbi:MAG: phosphatidate cytidylyltransferase, partial [Thermoleophilia bacterium]|nr:phosphatidate cytidylyltransferase [Thermoleophilia bacterium]
TVAVGTTVLGSAWVSLGLAHLVLVRRLDVDGQDAIFAVLFTVFAVDTVAFLAGRLVGRHRMTPVMSPGKTWEGFVAGALAGILVAFFTLYDTAYEGWRTFVLGGAIVLAATLGDLFESLVKRDLGAKDTGRILLGHGGVLDRIDSLLFAGPVAYYVFLAVGAS